MPINYYKLAPTWLYHLTEGPRLFKTQVEVDKAWKDGWFGPPWLMSKNTLISEQIFESKAKLIEAVREDSRYKGLIVNKTMNLETIGDLISRFEEDNLKNKPDELEDV